MVTAGDRFCAVQDTIAKMFRLESKRLHELHLGNKNIDAAIIKLLPRMIEIHVLTEDRSPVDPLVIQGDLAVGDIVIDNHLLRTDHNHFADLLWIQPADVDVSDNL